MHSLRPCLTVFAIVFALSVGATQSVWSAEPVRGYCLSGTKHSHYPITGQCSSAYESGNYKTALREWEPPAKEGNAFAQFNLGQMYREGKGVLKDYKEAVRWYTKAANQGNAKAQTNLGYMYHFGQGVSQDYKEAVKWYRKAANQGIASAQNNLGHKYKKGHGVLKD